MASLCGRYRRGCPTRFLMELSVVSECDQTHCVPSHEIFNAVIESEPTALIADVTRTALPSLTANTTRLRFFPLSPLPSSENVRDISRNM